MSLINTPYLNELRDEICKLVQLNDTNDILYSKMRLYGCMDQYFDCNRRRRFSSQIMDEVEKHVTNYLSCLPFTYRKLFVLYILANSNASMTDTVNFELQRGLLHKEDGSSLKLPWSISSKLKSFIKRQDQNVTPQKSINSLSELQCKTQMFQVDPNFIRFTLVPVPICPIKLRNEILSEPTRLSVEGLQMVSGNNGDISNHDTKIHSCLSQDWDDLIQKSWDSISCKIRKAYNKIKIRFALMCERNIYCGPFSIYVLLERQPNHPLCKRRVIHVDNKGHWLAHCDGGSQQRTIKFIDIAMKSFRDETISNCIRKQKCTINQSEGAGGFLANLNRVWLTGHAGSVRTLWLDVKLQILLSGSYDTSIRLWNLSENNYQKSLNPQTNGVNPVSFRNSRSKCIRIFRGHTDTVLCIWLDQTKLWPKYNIIAKKQTYSSHHSNNSNNNQSNDATKDESDATYLFASGSVDCTCCIWRLDENKPLWTMKHSAAVTSVGLRGCVCTTGESSGRIYVWRIGNKKPLLIKVLAGHTNAITALRFDNYHLVTSSKDKSAKIWSIIGTFSECIGTLIHTSEVLCVELIDLRVITGCSDGRIRIWNLLTQHCQRILPGNYRHDPIISIMPLENRLIVNTQHNVLALNFDAVQWEYHESVTDKAEEFWLTTIKKKSIQQNINKKSHSKPSYAESRYFRSRLVGSADPRLFRHPTWISESHKSTCRSLSAHSKSRENSTTSVCSDFNYVSGRFSRSKKKSKSFEFLISPPIPGTYAAKHRMVKRPKSAFTVTKELKQKEYENLKVTQHSNKALKLPNTGTYLKDMYTDLKLKHESLSAPFMKTGVDALVTCNLHANEQLKNLSNLLENDFDKEHENIQRMNRQRPNSAPQISMKLISANEARSFFPKLTLPLNNDNQKNDKNINISSIQLPQLVVSENNLRNN
ncbi:F-box/WD repeat-containing protein [Schistosoma japonicum]|uniref:F-box/WD repeat-containing protein n=1 Tax=Schistosoma japonicum TaxID=6182 RepID=A0A4Z2CXF2_SCHJA|nr:F-box/WD repeat-containing protein [Schistosoma japonicum]